MGLTTYSPEIPKGAAVDAAMTDVVGIIVSILEDIAGFWPQSEGWAPDDVAEMLAKARLDRLASTAQVLKHWINIPTAEMSDGELILAWANLGSLVEGVLKLFLCVYLRDYEADEINTKKTQAFHVKKQMLLSPDSLRLEVLISYFDSANIFGPYGMNFIKRVQVKRNSIHVFKDLDIGNPDEFHQEIRELKHFLITINSRLPYPNNGW